MNREGAGSSGHRSHTKTHHTLVAAMYSGTSNNRGFSPHQEVNLKACSNHTEPLTQGLQHRRWMQGTYLRKTILNTIVSYGEGGSHFWMLAYHLSGTLSLVGTDDQSPDTTQTQNKHPPSACTTTAPLPNMYDCINVQVELMLYTDRKQVPLDTKRCCKGIRGQGLYGTLHYQH